MVAVFECIVSAIVGFVIGAGLVVIMLAMPNTYQSVAKAAVQKCESTLPRNQHCVITAVPAEQSR